MLCPFVHERMWQTRHTRPRWRRQKPLGGGIGKRRSDTFVSSDWQRESIVCHTFWLDFLLYTYFIWMSVKRRHCMRFAASTQHRNIEWFSGSIWLLTQFKRLVKGVRLSNGSLQCTSRWEREDPLNGNYNLQSYDWVVSAWRRCEKYI